MKYLLILTTLLVGCHTNDIPKFPFKVTEIEELDKGRCRYRSSLKFNCATFCKNYEYIEDTCGKFQIGDTIILTKNKKEIIILYP